MSNENLPKNPYVSGFKFLGRKCEHCIDQGISCYEGALFNDTARGLVSMVLDEKRTFTVEGSLDTCKIANGKVSQEQGTASLRQAAEQEASKVMEQTLKEALERAREEAEESVNYLDLDHNNWK